MTLQEAIELVKARISWFGGNYTGEMLSHGEYPDNNDEAIATILNAVVKGELK